MARLFVLGGSGGVGHHVITLARAQGHDVTALIRAKSRALVNDAEQAGVRVVEGDALDAAALDAMAGHDAVLSSVGLQRTNAANPWSALTSPTDLNSRTASLIVAAAKTHGVKRLVAVSAAGVADSAPRMNLLMKFFVSTSNVGVAYRDLALMEGVYRDAGARNGLEWLCPRPTRLTVAVDARPVAVIEGFPMSAAISRQDVARFMLDALAVPDWSARWPTRTPTITSA